jgi:hypothetical protein
MDIRRIYHTGKLRLLTAGQLDQCMEIHRINHLANLVAVKVGTVYGDTVCQWSNCACSSRTYRPNAMHEAAHNLSQWQVATVIMSKI